MLFGSAAALPEGVFETSSTIRASAVSSATSGTCGENLTWTLNDGVLTISGTGAMTDYGSSNSPFLDRTDIQSVYIKSGVTSIGNLAFCSCTKLVNITIPDSVTRIGYNAFERCEDLTSVTLPNSIDSIYLKTFMCCYSLESVTLPDSITGIYTGAFYGCKKLKNINIPSSVTSIGGGAFSGCTSLTSLTIPSSVESIGSDAIDKECTIICEKGSKAEKYAKDNGLDYNYSDGDYLYKELADGTVEITKYNGNYTRFTITSTLGGKQVTSIGSDAFSNRAYLEKIIIPSSVTNIAEKAFASTPRLKKITIPDSVTTIGKNAFEKSTTIICKQGSEAQFYAAYNGNPIEYISGDYIYKDIDDETVEITGYTGKDMTLTITSELAGKTVTSIGDYAFSRSDLTSVTIPSSVRRFGEFAFGACYKLESAVIPTGVETITYDLFAECRGLKSVTIPSSVKSIEDGAFSNCSGLTSITIPGNVKYIGASAFEGCTGLKSLTIPSSVETIDDYAFGACGFTSLTVPKTVTKIGKMAIGYVHNEQYSLVKDDNFTVKCYKGTAAEKYAKDNEFKIEYIGVTHVAAKAATCTTDGNIEYWKHDGKFYSDANLTTEITQANTIVKAGHNWSKWTTTKAATCTADGSKTKTCSVCKKTETATITKLGHDYKATVVKPTCTAKGYTLHKCSRCGDNYKDTYKDATGHSWSKWTTTKKATCTTDGSKTRTCSVCKKTETATIAKLGHDYKATVVKPTCTAKGYTLHKCSRCGDSYKDTYKAALGHTWSKWTTTKAATCTADGSKTRTCSVCKKTETATIAKLGHDYKATVVKPTCTAKGYTLHKCSRCGDSYKDTYKDATGHSWSKWTTTKKATCTAAGSKTRTCSVCKKTETATIAKLGHDYKATVVKPTCTAKGYTLHKCSRCGDSYKDTYKAALGHTWSKWTTTKKATCTADGSKTRTCTVCKKTETATIAKLGHDYVTTVVAPTCTAKGYTLHKCSRCGDSYKDTYKAALGHTWSKWTTTKKATCTADGSKTRTCSVCKKTETATIAKLGHDYKATVVKPTCTAKGYTLHKCSRCGDSYKDTYKDATGHSWSKWTTTKAATCTADGVQTRKCTVCGKTESKTIAKTGHKFSTWKTTGFDFAKKTSTQTRKCSSCGNTETQTTKNAVSRFAGANRYDTAAMLSKASHKTTSDTVIIADAMTFQDALIAVPLAKAYNAPLLLANPNIVTKQTEAELARLKAKKIIIVNTNNALKSGTINALKNKYTTQIIRGSNCFETSKRVAEELQKKTKKAPTDVFFTTNKAFADALSISPVAALKGAPILYVDPSKKTLDSNILAYLKKVKGSIKNVYIVGGKVAVPAAIENSIKKALPKKNVKRFDGAQRYETCVMINKYFAKDLSSKTVCIAKGLDFPDALAGGVYAAATRQALFLADGKKLQDVQNTYLKSKNAGKITVFGGTVAVPDSLVKLIAKASV